MNDAISRLAVIQIIEKMRARIAHNLERSVGRAMIEILDEVGEDVGMLPSAQPEVIKCKDCKHWMPYEWMFNEVWQSQNIDDYPEDEISCNYCDVHMKSSDFCSQAVRREVQGLQEIMKAAGCSEPTARKYMKEVQDGNDKTTNNTTNA